MPYHFVVLLMDKTETKSTHYQGDNDSFGGRSGYYFDKLDNLVAAFRKELQAPDIPFIAGGLGDFLSSGRYGKYFTEYNSVNQALRRYADTRANSYFVSASDLTANADGLHFDAISQRNLGFRYFQAFDSKKNVPGPLDNETGLINRIQDRPLTETEKAALLEISFGRGELSTI